MDFTPLIHALIAVTAQLAVGKLTGNWWLGGAAACIWWIAREHTQAEYRVIYSYYSNKRANAPWWCGFEPRAWTLDGLLDWIIPIMAVVAVAVFASP